MSGPNNLTRIKNNQITDSTIWANAKIVPGSIVGSLFNSNITVTSDFTITGNLVVQGASTYATVASTNTYINDPLIVLNNAFSGTNSYDLGFIFNRGSLTNQAFYWDESSDTFKLIATNETGDTYGSIAGEVSYSNLQLGNITVQSTATAANVITTAFTASAANINLLTATSASFGSLSLVSLNNVVIGNVTPRTGAFTDLTASGNVIGAGFTALFASMPGPIGSVSPDAATFTTLQTTGLTQLNQVTAVSLNNTPIGNATPNTGAFTTLASNTLNVSGNVVAGLAQFAAINSTPIGNVTASSGAFTTLTATSTVSGAGFNALFASPPTIGNVSPAPATFTALTSQGATSLNKVTAVSLNNTPIGNATPSTGAFTTLTASGNVIAGQAQFASINSTPIGNTTASTGKFTTLTTTDLTSGRVVFTSTSGQLVDNAGLTFTANTVTVGGNAKITINGATATIATTDTNKDLTLAPNGTGVVDFNGTNAANLADPVSAQDAVTLAYLQTFGSSSIVNITQDDTDVTTTDTGTDGTITANANGVLAALINSSQASFYSGVLTVNATAPATATTGILSTSNTQAATSTTTGALKTAGGLGVAGNAVVGGQIKSTSTDQSTNSTSGAIITAGGVGIAKNLYVGGDTVLVGNLTVQGTTTAVQSQTLDVTDLNITVAKGAASSAAANGAGLTVDGAGATLTYTHATTSWNLNKDTKVTTTTAATDNATGALVTTGGAGIGGELYARSIQGTAIGNTTAASGAFTTLSASSTVSGAGISNLFGTPPAIGGNTANAGTFTTLQSTSLTTGSLTTASINATVIGNVTAASGRFTSLESTGNVVGGLASFASINNTPIGNATASSGAFTTLAASDTVSVNSTTEATSQGLGALQVLGGASIAKNLWVGGNLNVVGNNFVITSNSGVFYGDASGAGALYAGVPGYTPLPYTTIQSSGDRNGTLQLNHQNINAGNDATSEITATANDGNVTTHNFSIGITSSTYSSAAHTLLGAHAGYVTVSGDGDNNPGSGRLVIFTDTPSDIVFATNGALIADEAGRWEHSQGLIIKTGTAASNVATGALRVQGGVGITGDLYANVLHATSAVIGSLSLNSIAVAAINDTVIGNVTPRLGQFTSLISANVQSGFIGNTGTVFSGASLNVTGNVLAATVGATTVNATTGEFRGNVVGGLARFAAVNATPVGNATASTGAFTTLTATETVYANATTDTSSLTTGAVVVAGGAAVGKTLWVGEGAVINSTATSENFQVKGTNATTLIYANGADNTVTLGGSNTASIAGATVRINGTDSMILPKGSTAARPSNSGNVDIAGMIRFNTSLNDMEYYTGTGWTTPGATVSLVVDQQFAGDGSTTVFELSQAASTNSAMISINGVIQIPTLAYAVSGTTITFTEAPAAGDVIDVRILTISTSLSTLASSNGYASVDVSDANNNYANLTVGLTGATVRLSADAGGNLTIDNGTKLTYQQTGVAVTTSPTTIDSFDKTAFRAAKYLITFTNGSTSYETTEIIVIHNGNTATRAQYGTISTSGNTLGSYTVTISSNNVLLQCAAVSGTGNVKAMATYIRA